MVAEVLLNKSVMALCILEVKSDSAFTGIRTDPHVAVYQ